MTLCKCLGVTALLSAVAVGMLYSGTVTRMGAFKFADSYTNAETGAPHLRGLIPAFHHGFARGFSIDEIPAGGLEGRVAVVTGANTGLGLSTAKILAGKGAHVVMGCRSVARCEEAAAAVRRSVAGTSGAGTVEVQELDLSSLASVHAFAVRVHEAHPKIHSLVLNAGIMMTDYGLTVNGIEQQIGVNHFGHFYLTRLLLPTVRRSGTAAQPATIVVVSSSAHYRTYDHGISLTLAELNDRARYNRQAAYGQSKLANILFAQELAERESAEGFHVLVNAIHPGAVDTELSRYLLDLMKGTAGEALFGLVEPVLKAISRSIMWDSDTAALTQVYAAVGPRLLRERTTGKYFHPIARENPPHQKFATDQRLQKGLWALSEEVAEKFEALQPKVGK